MRVYNFSNNLGAILRTKGISAYKFSKMMYVNCGTVYSWLKKNTAPNAELIVDICNVLDVSADELLFKR